MHFGSGAGYSDWKVKLAVALGVGLPGTGALAQQIPILGETYAHDPSPVLLQGTTYFYYSTGQDILSRQSTNLSNWSDGPAVFSTLPTWTTNDVPGFTGDFWAPTVNYFDGLYHMYYAVSTFGSQVSGIGLATSPTLNPSNSNYAWTDQGPVIESKAGYAYNTIDPSVITAADGTMWMSFGSYWTGIYEEQLNPTTGMLLNPNSTPIHLSQRAGSDTSDEASYLYYRNGYYYLFENWGSCCDGVNSTYNVRMGRSTSVNGPFTDQSGTGLLAGGGSIFLQAQGQYIGPGQVGIYSQSGQDYVSYHYYNGSNSGTPAFAMQDLYWTPAGWPTTTEPLVWSASTSGGTAVDGSGTWDLSHTNFLYNSSNQVWNTSGYGGITFGSSAGPAGTVTLAQNVSLQTMTFNASSSGSYTLAGNGYTITIATGGTGGIITANANATIAANISAGNLTKLGTGALTLTGATTATNFFPRQGTTIVSGTGSLTTATHPTTTADNFASIGQVAGDSATLTVMNSAALTIAGDFNIGDTGTAGTPLSGTLNVQNSATVNVRDLFVGKYVNASGTVNQSGGTVQEVDNGTPSGDWRIGGAGSSDDGAAVGIYNLSGGTFTTGTNLQVGVYGTGTITQTGGTATIGANGGGYLSIGRYPGGVGLYDLSSGNGTLNNTTGGGVLIVGEQGTGTLKVGGSSTVNATGLSVGHNNGGIGNAIQTGGSINLGSNGLEFGPAASSTGSAVSGIFTLSGGTLKTPSITINPIPTVTGTFDFNGGTLTPTTNNAVLMTAGLTHAYVQAGGAIINTNGNNTTISQTLSHDPALGSTVDGGLTKAGTGTLLLTGVEAYTGPTAIIGGTLQLQAAPTAPVTGSLVWFDAADSSTITTSGGLVTAWTDKGTAGSSMNAAQGVAGSGPTVTSGALNGHSDFAFNNVSGLVTAGNLSISGSADRSLFVVGSRGNGSMFFANEGPTGSTNLAYGSSSETANSYLYTWNNDVTFGIQPAGSSEIFDSELSNTGTALSGDLITNGALTTASKTVAANTTDSQLDLGYRPGATSSGTLAEVIEYSSALSATQRQQVEQYLDYKWFGIGNILPAATPVTVYSGATLDVNGASQVIASLSGASGGSVTLGTGTLTMTTAGTALFGGTISGTGNLVMQGTGTQRLGGADTYTGTTTVNSGTLNLGTNPNTGIELRTSGGISIAGAAAMVMGTNAVHSNRTLLITPTLTIAGTTGAWTGKLDLGDNDLLVHNGSLSQITDEVRSGFDAGHAPWTGLGITSSTAAASTSHLTALGVIQDINSTGNPIYGSGAALGLFDNDSAVTTDILVKYTYFGDANLDGRVDGSDYTLIDNGFNNQLTGWYNGDFNYDNKVDGSDYTLIDDAFNTQTAALSAQTTNLVADSTAQLASTTGVPEPTSIGLLTVGGLSIRRRRKSIGG